MTLKDKYEAEIRHNWNWDYLFADCESNVDEEGFGTAYLGTIQSITPSGKVYMPWATRNLHRCKHCDGSGKLPNPRYRASAERRRCRRAMRQNRNREPYNLKNRMRRMHWETLPCPVCGGCGMPEAHRDEVWREALESVAEEHGMFMTGNDGDGDSILVGRRVTKDTE